jgi:DUF4097 and DUF4098 domain-containing protein YvlB
MRGEIEMERRSPGKTIMMGLCALSLMIVGCTIQCGGWGQAKYERTTEQQAPLGTNTAIDVESRNGSIAITGGETNEFHVTATITGYAPTENEAQELAEKTQIRLESAGNTFRVRADMPTTGNNRGVSVSYTITAPKRINVTCESAYGSLHIADIEGTVAGKSSNGSIQVESVQGPVNVRTSYGSITCRHVAGQMTELKSTNGSITIDDLKGPAKVETSYGSITCENFSDGDYHLRSQNGRVAVAHGSVGECDASSSYGAVVCTDVKGNPVKLSSENGSVELANVNAPDLSLSTSYGAIKARQITTADLTAHSGNGGVEIVCTEACPGDLKAQVKSSYGSIDFTAPPQFAGQVRLATGYGSVRTGRPVTVSGEIDKKHISGTIGEGTGSLHLETSNGSVDLK